MTDIIAAKAADRQTAFAARKLAFAAGQGRAAAILAEYLADHQNQTLAGYMPMRTEADPLPAMAAHPNAVGVPVIIGPAQALRFRQWTPDARMIEGDFKALIPETGDWVIPQIVIVPMVAFDARGYRLGYGGGFYDRTLQALKAAGPVLAVGFAFAAQELAEVPIEATDQRLDALVTERGVTRFT